MKLKILARSDEKTKKRFEIAPGVGKREIHRGIGPNAIDQIGFGRIRSQNCLPAKTQQQILFLKKLFSQKFLKFLNQ